MGDTILLELTKSNRKYKCPFCDKKDTAINLVYHIQEKHEEMIPEGYTATRVVFNYINHKDHGTCVNPKCHNETQWNEDAGKYDRYCSQKCIDEYIKTRNERMMKKYGTTNLLNDEEQQKKMLSNRKISGEYKWSDGTTKSYCGSYEKKLLEFLDKTMHCKSKDVQSPGPMIVYEYEGEYHKWITDIFYVPANLVFDVKDGGNNPNNRKMVEYREKQIAKERAIQSQKEYNYIRLTNNNFEQLLYVLSELKEKALEGETKDTVISINESSEIIDEEVGGIPPQGATDMYLAPCTTNYSFTAPDLCLTTSKYYDDMIFKVIDGKLRKVKPSKKIDEYTLFKYKLDDGQSKLNEILENVNKEVSPDYLYKTLTNSKDLLDCNQLFFDEEFQVVLNGFQEAKEKIDIIKESIQWQYDVAMNKARCLPVLNPRDMKLIKESLSNYTNINITQALNGKYFAINEETNEVSKQYDDLDELMHSTFIFDFLNSNKKVNEK